MPRRKKRPAERSLYPVVARWLEQAHRCFDSFTNKGLRYSRCDVVGIRDTGGNLAGNIEAISVEVKRGTEPFATAAGQARGYAVYAHRVYLADLRPDGFTRDEVEIAGTLGIGLVSIYQRGKGYSCREVLSGPLHTPLESLHLKLLEKFTLVPCSLCGSFVKTGVNFSGISRRFGNAYSNNRPFIFWNFEVAERKRRLGLSGHEKGATLERRYLCVDCVDVLHAAIEDTSGLK